MNGIPIAYSLGLAAVLFILGVAGVLTRRNLLFTLMSLEIMINASALAFIAAAARWGQADGQVMFIFILTAAGAEAAVGLGLLVQVHRKFKNLDSDVLSSMRG
ncbi:MAG: NADH-quinone oxidoreductase subunit NuoK [Candidatus Omnitrophota bacterium]